MEYKLVSKMNKIKIIKTEQDYKEALNLVEELIAYDPQPDSEKGEQLNLLTTLIHDYEARAFPETLPSPIQAIRFRMEQNNLKSVDLIPFLGSRSRVSEILSGKRRLTLEMVRALSEGLGIPAKVLIQKPESSPESVYENWDDRLVSEMEKRSYFGGFSLKTKQKKELLQDFFSPIEAFPQLMGMFRQSHYRSSPLTDKHALSAWATQVYKKAQEVKTPNKYKHGIIDLNFMQKLAKLSIEDNGPVLAQEYLRKQGIVLVIEPHFSKTYLDGATILINKDNPIIGLTLRYDRLDNFWFTLMHEVAHIALHYNEDISLFYDEFENVKGLDIGSKEREADNLASEALVPSSKWEISPAKLIPSSIAASSLAKEIGVHVAIIAGKIRYEGGKWIYLNNIIGKETVRKYFPNEKWDKK
jgi:HTH-type transcriptional regulator/antitoxin HigA